MIAGSSTQPWTPSHMLEGSSSCQQVPLLTLKWGVHIVPPQTLKSKQRCTGWKGLTWRLHLVCRAETAGSIFLLAVWMFYRIMPHQSAQGSLCRLEKWLGRPWQHLLSYEPLYKGANSISAFSITALRILLVCSEEPCLQGEGGFCVAFLWQALLLCATFQANY